MAVSVLRPEALSARPCRVVDDPVRLRETCAAYGADESRLSALPRAVFFPTDAAETAGAFEEIARQGWRAQLSGGRTGIVGGATPVEAEAVVTLEKMNRPLGLGRSAFGGWHLRAEPGVSLADIERILDARNPAVFANPSETEKSAIAAWTSSEAPALWFPVDPTEMSAHLGGATAVNASGARSFRYGAIRGWVRALSLVLADGRRLDLRRGRERADGLAFSLVAPGGSVRRIELPDLAIPATKRTLGYHAARDMDLLDLIVGSEGTLGAVVEIELALAERPAARLGALAVLDTEAQAIALVRRARASARQRDAEAGAVGMAALEYFDPAALAFMKTAREAAGGGAVPALPRWDGAAVYAEFHGDAAVAMEEAAETFMAWLEAAGGRADDTWAEFDDAGMARQKAFRHAVPETVNAVIGRRAAACPGLHKVGTDMAAPDAALERSMAMYREGLAASGLEAVMFGHIGDNHLHVNILPRDMDEFARAKALYREWAGRMASMGGAVAAEHGIGRLKKSLLAEQFDAATLARLAAVRAAFDPEGRLNPGVLT